MFTGHYRRNTKALDESVNKKQLGLVKKKKAIRELWITRKNIVWSDGIKINE